MDAIDKRGICFPKEIYRKCITTLKKVCCMEAVYVYFAAGGKWDALSISRGSVNNSRLDMRGPSRFLNIVGFIIVCRLLSYFFFTVGKGRKLRAFPVSLGCTLPERNPSSHLMCACFLIHSPGHESSLHWMTWILSEFGQLEEAYSPLGHAGWKLEQIARMPEWGGSWCQREIAGSHLARPACHPSRIQCSSRPRPPMVSERQRAWTQAKDTSPWNNVLTAWSD